MSRVMNRYTKSKITSPAGCESKPQPCSVCGQLECLCRPRFFAGQVLTADDLNRLDYYIRTKHRLHNRQLHGWGVVNGLEVTCDPCGKGVVVGCGYALSPCGDDIVVCEPVQVDVCALIQACREAERLTQPCAPFQHSQPVGCGADSEWVLAIRYTETPARGVKPLMSGNGTSCQGGCSSASCTCKTTSARNPRTAPVQCEPTIICEGFEFEVYRKPQAETGISGLGNNSSLPTRSNQLALNPDSELFQRMQCCLEILIERLPELQNIQTNLNSSYLCNFKDFLQRYLSSKPGYNCELLARINAIACSSNETSSQQLREIFQSLGMVYLDAILACFCSALLPPCPQPQSDARVPIATFKVSTDSCQVLSICNWTRHRKIVTSFPTLEYWLDLLPFGVQLRHLIEQICCRQIMGRGEQRGKYPSSINVKAAEIQSSERNQDDVQSKPEYYEHATKGINPEVADPERLAGVAQLLDGMFTRRDQPLDPMVFVESLLLRGGDSMKKNDMDTEDSNSLSAAEIANLPQFLLLNQILEPIFTGAFDPPSGKENVTMKRSAAQPDEMATLKEQIDALQARLDAQDKLIAALGQRKKGG